mgnify:CR=1 FL=1
MKNLIIAIALFITLSSVCSAQTSQGKTYHSVIQKSEMKTILAGNDTVATSLEADTVKSNIRKTGNFFVDPKNVPIIVNRQMSAFQGTGLVIVISEKIFLLKAEYNDYGKLTTSCTVATEISATDINNCSMLVLGVRQ